MWANHLSPGMAGVMVVDGPCNLQESKSPAPSKVQPPLVSQGVDHGLHTNPLAPALTVPFSFSDQEHFSAVLSVEGMALYFGFRPSNQRFLPVKTPAD